jgi:hypothetical protein|tara:strand:+ start:22915 stop:23148 length:234 start_codon:yes stop_codon:yes gene_type:complete
MKNNKTCFDVSVQECIEACPQEVIHCSVRLLRETVLSNEPLTELVEHALDEHWRDAFTTGFNYKSESYRTSSEQRMI